jgi:hypothetical protein
MCDRTILLTNSDETHDVFVLSNSVIITREEKFVAIGKFKKLQAEQNYREMKQNILDKAGYTRRKASSWSAVSRAGGCGMIQWN